MRGVTGLLLLTLIHTVCAQHAPAPLQRAKAEQVGMSTERLQRLRTFLKGYIDHGELAGAVTVVTRRGKLVEFDAQGYSDLESRKPLRTDDIFRIASMTKPIATVGALMLLEEGKYLLEEPVSKYIPAFRDMRVGVGRPGDTGYQLVPANREVTIHDVFTHRSGLSGSGRGGQPTPPSQGGNPLAELVQAVAKNPLLFQPGTAWNYGFSTDVLGHLIEIWSGQNLDEYLRTKVLGPLGMNDTHFRLPKEKMARLTPVYQKHPGKDIEKVSTLGSVLEPRYYSASGGLVSTPADYARFGQMLVNGGELEGKRLLSKKTIELMTARSWSPIPLSFLSGQYFGLGVAVKEDNPESGLLGSAGAYGWSGAYNTYFRVDPKEQLLLILFVQITPGNNIPLQYGFHNGVMQAILD